MKKIHLCVVLITLVLTACASPTWNKSGVSQYETQNQLSQCRYEMGLAKVDQKEREVLLNQCMKSKGFRYN